ncbi:MAG TPA: AraC family transcriptional regulator [Candidatus Saccharimonadales bacterium]|nr:AraC family transcriptional regulator [Candidatus Saccharimonadales bacterium]
MSLTKHKDGVVFQNMAEIENMLFHQPLQDLVENLGYYRRLDRTWHFIEREYADPNLRLEKAAQASGISKNHLNVLLRRTTGFTFHQLLIRYRLLQALRRMRARNYSLFEIALESGFSSSSVFGRNFRSLLGTTPKEIRGIGILDE